MKYFKIKFPFPATGPIHKKKSKLDIEDYCPVSILLDVSSMKGVCLIKCIVTLIKFSLNIIVDSDKVTTLNIAFFYG